MSNEKQEAAPVTEGQPLSAQEIAQQVAQAVGQANEALLSKLSAMLAGQVVKAATETDYSDVGLDEFAKFQTENQMNNAKRTYDEYQEVSLESIKRNRAYVDKLLGDAQTSDNVAKNIANQALQNAVETANMVSKQAVRHSDIAIDRQWNVDEQGYTAADIIKAVSSDTTAQVALKDILVAALAEALKK